MTMTNISTIGGLSNKTPTKISKKFIWMAWTFFKIVLVRRILFICTSEYVRRFFFFFFLQSWSYKNLDYDLFKTNVPTIQKPGNWFYLIFFNRSIDWFDQLTRALISNGLTKSLTCLIPFPCRSLMISSTIPCIAMLIMIA